MVGMIDQQDTGESSVDGTATEITMRYVFVDRISYLKHLEQYSPSFRYDGKRVTTLDVFHDICHGGT